MLNLKNAKILVTGGHGFLGSCVIKKLKKNGVSENQIFAPRSFEYDLLKWENCQKAVKDQDIIIHLAAKVGGIGLNKEKPGEFFYENLLMGSQLMEAARREKVKKFVTIGTVCVYPKYTSTPFKEEDLWMGYPEEITAPYAMAKKMLLVQGQAFRQQYGFNAIFLLPVNLYGPYDNFEEKHSHVVPAIIKKIYEAKKQKKPYVEIWGTGNATREFLFVEDAAEAIILATKYYDKPYPINIGSGEEISIRELTKLICNFLGYSGEIRWDATKPEGQPRRWLDVSKAKKEFGFVAKMKLKEGLKKTVQWYVKHQTLLKQSKKSI